MGVQPYSYTTIHRKGNEHVVPDLSSRTVTVVEDREQPKIDLVQEIEAVKDKWYLTMVKRVQQDPLQYKLWRIECNKLYVQARKRSPICFASR